MSVAVIFFEEITGNRNQESFLMLTTFFTFYFLRKAKRPSLWNNVSEKEPREHRQPYRSLRLKVTADAGRWWIIFRIRPVPGGESFVLSFGLIERTFSAFVLSRALIMYLRAQFFRSAFYLLRPFYLRRYFFLFFCFLLLTSHSSLFAQWKRPPPKFILKFDVIFA